ncbi:MAG: recombinase family protein [Planctomycetes bacterium]|nr:recombinase family protein [Planctomycetota bacterium]
MSVKAVSYLRVSGKGQVEGDGFERQRVAIQLHAQQHGLEIVREYREEGISGTRDADERPALSELLAEIAGCGVQIVLVERADRLARDLILGELLLAEFRKLEVAVIAVDAGVDLTAADADPTKKLIRQILGALSEWEKTALVLKLRVARQRMRRFSGRCEGDKPFGFKPGEAAILLRITELSRKPRNGKQLSAGRIAKILNHEERPTRSGKPWSRGSVWVILQRVKGRSRSIHTGVTPSALDADSRRRIGKS